MMHIKYGLGVLLLISTLTHAQVTIYYDAGCSITMKELATHYRVAKVDTVSKKFVDTATDFWMNDSLVTRIGYDSKGSRNGLLAVRSANGEVRLSGQYSKGSRSGVWEIKSPAPLSVDFGNRKAKTNAVIDSVELCLAKKERFEVSPYIRKHDYPDIYSLLRTKRSQEGGKDGSFTVVEERPQFPGGFEELGRFVSAYLHYPDEAKRNGVKGQVVVEFTIGVDGAPTDFKVVKGLGYGCDEEAIRVLKLLPDWVPGYQRGRPVKTKFRVPITFDN